MQQFKNIHSSPEVTRKTNGEQWIYFLTNSDRNPSKHSNYFHSKTMPKAKTAVVAMTTDSKNKKSTSGVKIRLLSAGPANKKKGKPASTQKKAVKKSSPKYVAKTGIVRKQADTVPVVVQIETTTSSQSAPKEKKESKAQLEKEKANILSDFLENNKLSPDDLLVFTHARIPHYATIQKKGTLVTISTDTENHKLAKTIHSSLSDWIFSVMGGKHKPNYSKQIQSIKVFKTSCTMKDLMGK